MVIDMPMVGGDQQQGIFQLGCHFLRAALQIPHQHADLFAIHAVFVHGVVGFIPVGVNVGGFLLGAQGLDLLAEGIIGFGERRQEWR